MQTFHSFPPYLPGKGASNCHHPVIIRSSQRWFRSPGQPFSPRQGVARARLG